MATPSQADLLEAIPFVREITPLDLLDLPAGLFDALPKPCNLKRSASAGGPIWPPVLTNVLVNGLLILHHKPHLVGKQGLEEHYNWLSAFIYRQTRGWDHSALSRNAIEAKRAKPGERLVGIIRNRKQISSKVQTIGEYLKDTHWAYVTQGPRSLKDTPSTGSVAGSPAETSAKITPNGEVDQPLRSTTFPDVSQVSLQLAWSPPTPFSLPVTPRQSPFLYPAEVPDYEFVDARLLGYDPREWPEFESQMANSRRTPLPLLLDNYILGGQGEQRDFEGPLSLTSASMTVHFATQPSHTEGVSPSLILGRHQLTYMSQDNGESLQRVLLGDLDRNTRDLVQTFQAGGRQYHVDLPIHLPTQAEDRAYLAHNAGPEYHVKCRVEFQAGTIPPHSEELKTVSKIYFFSGRVKDHNPPEILEDFQEVTPLRSQHQDPCVLVTHGLATLFAGKLWGDLVEELNSSDAGKSHKRHQGLADNLYARGADLSRYRIVQNILPRSHKIGTASLLTVIYSPRLVASPRGSTARLIIRDPMTGSDPINSDFLYKVASTDNTPIHTPRMHPKQDTVNLRRSNRSGTSTAMERQDQHASKTPLLQPMASSQTAGPVRNTRSHSRSRSTVLMRRPVDNTSPLAPGTKFPSTPCASPLIPIQQPRRNSIAPAFLHPTPACSTYREEQQSHDFATYGPITTPTAEHAMFDVHQVDGWSSIMGTSGNFVSNAEMIPAYGTSSSSLWTYPRDSSGEPRRQAPLATEYYGSQSEVQQRSLPNGDSGGHLLYYGGASWA